MEQIVFNSEKHHMQAIAKKLCEYVEEGENSLPALMIELVNKGVLRDSYNGVIDVYIGEFSVERIKSEITEFLGGKGLLEMEAYKAYLEREGQIKRRGHYTSFELSDKTSMTMRLIESEVGFVHVHPGRYSPNTFRIKANTLKTAILARFLSLVRKKPMALDIINEARIIIGLSPVNENIDAIYFTLQKLEECIEKINDPDHKGQGLEAIPKPHVDPG